MMGIKTRMQRVLRKKDKVNHKSVYRRLVRELKVVSNIQGTKLLVKE